MSKIQNKSLQNFKIQFCGLYLVRKNNIEFMKAFLFGFFCVVAISSFSSCNKDYTCRCTFDNADKNFDIKIKKVRKNDAKVICDKYSAFVGNCQVH
ncbi:MAG: hypothetical protein IT215_03145 [Chitinophagaceae bacterium]|nr:MAG: hypothetical protein UZ11_BCD004001341 [Bacteroidetes bacterium OLB11]MCC6447661.1 hypothetical protein [Chitinophagaceae bacterium]HMN32352.1 hypothetical protein [Chitinophagaceae bacterium]